MITKTCTTCGKEKPINEFGFSRPGVYRSNCKKCHYEYTKLWNKNNPDKIAAAAKRRKPKLKKWRKKNKASKNNYNKKWLKENPGKRKEYKLRSFYGISMGVYNKLLEKQGFRCAICGIHQDDLSKSLCVDHNHNTNIVRGLLCQKCNSAIGFFNDDEFLLENAILYLIGQSKK